MLRNFSFLIEDVIAGCALPGSWGPLHMDLEEAKSEGITALVSLTEDPLDPDVVEKSGLRYLHLPVADFSPPTIEQVEEFVAFVREERDRGGAVLAHCHAGVGRTGTMLAAFLVSEGESTQRAIEAVRNARPGSIETATQLALLKSYEKKRRK